MSQAEYDKLLALLNASCYCPKETDFHPAQEPEAKSTSTEETGLNITIPLDKVNVGNLTNLLDAKRISMSVHGTLMTCALRTEWRQHFLSLVFRTS